MKTKACRCCKQEFPLETFRIVCGRRGDGRNCYCPSCCNEKSRVMRRNKAEFKLSRKPSSVCRAEKLPIPVVRQAIANGFHSRDEIARVTRLSEDVISDALAELCFETLETYSKEVNGGDRQFFLKVA